MVPSLVLFILFHEDDLNTQRRENRIMSDDLEEKLRPKSDDEKNNEIEIVEMSQTAKINRKSSESPELANAVTPNYWESLKIVMTSKVGSFLFFYLTFHFLIVLNFFDICAKKGLYLFNAFDLFLVFYRHRHAILGNRLLS